MYELERVEEAQLFCAHHRLPRRLSRAIVSHIRYYCNYNYVFDHERIMASIPTYLQNHVTQHLSQSLSELDMFRHLPKQVIGQIALKMTSTSCNSGHTLFKKGMLFILYTIQICSTMPFKKRVIYSHMIMIFPFFRLIFISLH